MSEPSSDAVREDSPRDFERQAAQPQPGLLADFAGFLLHNKKWWLAPIIMVLLLLGVLLALGNTAAAPFIYTLF